MNIKEFFKPTNKLILYWLILGLVILVAGGVVWYYSNLMQEQTTVTCGPQPPIVCGSGMRLTCIDGKWDCRKTEQKTEDIILNYCQQDSDCVAIQDGCCGCGGGGKNLAINKESKDKYETRIQKECRGMGCIAVESNDPSCFNQPACVNNKCQFKEKAVFTSQEECEQNRCVVKEKLTIENQSTVSGLQFSVRPEKHPINTKKMSP